MSVGMAGRGQLAHARGRPFGDERARLVLFSIVALMSSDSLHTLRV
jgi:hypothetical protein